MVADPTDSFLRRNANRGPDSLAGMTQELTEELSPADIAARSEQIAEKLRPHLPPTPLLRFGALSDELDAEVLVKCEHLQRTGSFKARGSMAKIMTLTDEQRERGVVTASTGNHALGVGNALATLGGRGIVYLPENASPSKVAALRRFGLELRAEGTDSGVLEPVARAYAAEHGLAYISPYNDPDIIAGQGTVGVEILEQLAGEAWSVESPRCSRSTGRTSRCTARRRLGTRRWLRRSRPARSSRSKAGKPCRTARRAASSPAVSRSTCAGVSSTTGCWSRKRRSRTRCGWSSTPSTS
jgi:hypothetical protein